MLQTDSLLGLLGQIFVRLLTATMFKAIKGLVGDVTTVREALNQLQEMTFI